MPAAFSLVRAGQSNIAEVLDSVDVRSCEWTMPKVVHKHLHHRRRLEATPWELRFPKGPIGLYGDYHWLSSQTSGSQVPLSTSAKSVTAAVRACSAFSLLPAW